MYLAQRQDPGSVSTLIVASRGEAAALAAPLREAVRQIDPGMPISGVRTIEDFYNGNAVGIVTALVVITSSMGLLGLVLAMVGLYGLVAYVVARQTREIGIRMAIGAQRGSVLRMVMRLGCTRALWGVGFGILGCAASGRITASGLPHRRLDRSRHVRRRRHDSRRGNTARLVHSGATRRAHRSAARAPTGVEHFGLVIIDL